MDQIFTAHSVNITGVVCIVCIQTGYRIFSLLITSSQGMNAKECSNYHTIALISHVSKIMLKILQAMLQQYVNRELQMYKLSLEKAEEPEIKLPTPAGSQKKAR